MVSLCLIFAGERERQPGLGARVRRIGGEAAFDETLTPAPTRIQSSRASNLKLVKLL